MRSFKFMLALCTLATIALAQNTGQTLYGHGGVQAFLSTGTYVNNNPGFIMGGYLPVTSTGATGFLIDRVDMDGLFSSGSTFANQYMLRDAGTTCNGPLVQDLFCYGISVIESPPGPAGNISYAMCGAFEAGFLFATLDAGGFVLNSALYTIPTGAVPEKPLVALASSGDYYMCGSYELAGTDFMCAIKIDPNAANIWSQRFSLAANNATLEARAIVEESYPGAPELVIVGEGGTVNTTDAFFLTLNAATGGILIYRALASGQICNESISSIALAASNGGFIVGGSTQMTPGPGQAWMARLNANGTINWTSRIDPSTDNTAGEVIGVQERLNSYASPFYEYYGITIANSGMMVLKLDQAGNAFSQGTNTNNEFVFNDATSGNIALSGAISYVDQGTGGTINSLHAFGTDVNSPGQFLLNQSYFNGATANCSSPAAQNLTVMRRFQGPSITYTYALSTIEGLDQCPTHTVDVNQLSYAPFQPCYSSSPPASPYVGDNTRMGSLTGVADHHKDKAVLVTVSPNPAINTAEVRYLVAESGDVKIVLSDLLGREIRTLDSGYRNAGENSLHIDANELDLQTGVYFVKVDTKDLSSQQKLVLTRN